MKKLLILGWRNGLLPVITAVGYQTCVINHQLLPRRIQHHLHGHCSLNWDSPLEHFVLASQKLYPGTKPDAIIAVTEAAVVPAAALRTALGVAGINLTAAQQAHDKYLMKQRFAAAKLPHTDFVLITSDTQAQPLATQLQFPIVLKPRGSSGSRNIVIAHTLAELNRALTLDYLAERFIHGTEMSVESFVTGGQVQFCNFTQYFVPRHANILPFDTVPTDVTLLRTLNQQVITTLGIERGMTHLELFLTPHGMVIGEIAVRPPGGYIMDLLALAYDFDPWQAFIRVETGEPVTFPQQAKRYAGALLWHPGAGVLKAIQGMEQIQTLPGMMDVTIKIKPEDIITTRLGVGQDVGRALITGPTYTDVTTTLQQTQQLLTMELYS